MARSLQPYNWLIIVGICAALFGGATALQAMTPTKPDAPEIIADQNFTTIDNQTISLNQFKGKTILVHFWASWCPPCVKELPLLLQTAKDRPDIAVITISIDQNLEDMTNFLSHIHNLSTVTNVYFVRDPTQNTAIAGKKVYDYPETFVIGPDMTLVDHIEGGLDWRHYNKFPPLNGSKDNL